ncbi:MAG TPA: protein kinase, partial [Actinotalea sp.]|nr:protein kinase [Actinotalea sp.]
AATDLVDGVTVADLLETTGPLRWGDALRLVAGVLDGLAYAHARGVLHLDLSATNVMVPVPDGRHDLAGAVLLDLGGATWLPEGGLVQVSPHFASPEIATGQDAGPRADVYSVGCLLHLLLTGRTPFRGAAQEVLEQQVHRLPEPPSALRIDLPADVDQLVLATLAKDPADRPSVASLLARVGALAANDPGPDDGPDAAPRTAVAQEPDLPRATPRLELAGAGAAGLAAEGATAGTAAGATRAPGGSYLPPAPAPDGSAPSTPRRATGLRAVGLGAVAASQSRRLGPPSRSAPHPAPPPPRRRPLRRPGRPSSRSRSRWRWCPT